MSTRTELAEERDQIELEELKREQARRDVADFCEYCFGWPAHAVRMHDEWQEHITRCIAEGRNAGIMAPRDHGKTQQVARARVLWELGVNSEPRLAWCPNIRIKLFQNTDDKASETVQQISRDITENPRVRMVFPRLVPARLGDWTKHKLFLRRTDNLRDASLEGAGAESHSTSGRADLIVKDDLCDLKNSVLEPARRKKLITTHDAVIMNLLEPHAVTVDIATAWHEEDLNAELRKRKGWDWLMYRIQEQPGAPMVSLWDKWGIAELEDRLDKIGRREFDRGYNNWPWGEEDSLVDWQAVRRCMDPSLVLGELPPGVPLVNCAVGYDLAISQKKDSSWFAAYVLGMLGGGKVIPLEIIRKRMPFRMQIQTAIALEKRWNPVVHVVENNAYQQSFVEQLKTDDPSLVVEGFTTGKQKMDPEIGLPSLAPGFESGRWIIPVGGRDGEIHDGESTCECPMDVWLKELKHFPGATYDLLMASWFVFNRLRMWGAGAADIEVQEAGMATALQDEAVVDDMIPSSATELGEF